MGLILIAASTCWYKFSYDGDHDLLQWYMHLGLWGQNQFFWLVAIIYDSEFTRELYFKSSFATGAIPYLGVPLYMTYAIFFSLGDRDHVYGPGYLIATLVGWGSYLVVMIMYSKHIISALYNYWMMEVALDMYNYVLKNREADGITSEGGDDPTIAFDSGD